MAMLNLNSILCNGLVNDNVVIAVMGIGSQRAVQALAIQSLGWPVPTGPEPTAEPPAHRDLCDTSGLRIGRSATCPNAGGLRFPYSPTDSVRRMQLSTAKGFMKSQRLELRKPAGR